MGTKSLMTDLGLNLRIRLHEDSSAAKGITERRGLGKVRHIETNQLWLQEKVREKVIEVCKVKGIDNLADALTKHVNGDEIGKHLAGTNCKIEWGRHELMPEVANGEETESRGPDPV